MFTKPWWAATIQRVVRSFAASLFGILTANGTGILDTDWIGALSVAGMAAVVTFLLCIIGSQVGGAGPAFGHVEITSPPAPPIDNEDVKP